MTRLTSLKGGSEHKGNTVRMPVSIATTGWGQKTKKGTTERKGRRTQGDCKHRRGRLGKLFKFIQIQGSRLYTGTTRKAFVKITVMAPV